MGRPRKRQRQEEDATESISAQAFLPVGHDSLDIDLNDHSLPSFHDWTMPSFDMPADFADTYFAAGPEKAFQATPLESQQQHQAAEITTDSGPFAPFWNGDYPAPRSNEATNAILSDKQPQHDEAESTPFFGAIGPMSHFWNTDYSSVSTDTAQTNIASVPSINQ